MLDMSKTVHVPFCDVFFHTFKFLAEYITKSTRKLLWSWFSNDEGTRFISNPKGFETERFGNEVVVVRGIWGG
jgi:hypothetical protein